MANGWTPDRAVQHQINNTINNIVMNSRARIPAGKGRRIAWNAITEYRRRAVMVCPKAARHALKLRRHDRVRRCDLAAK